MTSIVDKINNAKLMRGGGNILVLLVDDEEVGFYDFASYFPPNSKYYGKWDGVISYLNHYIESSFVKELVEPKDEASYIAFRLQMAQREAVSKFVNKQKINEPFLLTGYFEYLSQEATNAAVIAKEELDKIKTSKLTFFQRLFGVKS